MIRNLWRKLRELFPPQEKDWIGMTIQPNGWLKLEYSSEEYFYQHFKRQFDAARELHDMMKQKEGRTDDASKKSCGL